MGIFGRTGKAVSLEALRQGSSVAAQFVEEATGFPVSLLLEAGFTFEEILDAADKKLLLPNSYLRDNGHDGGPSPETESYLRVRKYKKVGGAVYSGVGTGVQVGLDIAGFGMGGVDAFGLAKHGASEASTLAHLTRLGLLSRKVKQSAYLVQLVEALIKVKVAKATVRGGKIAAAVIPNSIASNVVSIAVSMGAVTAEALLKDLIGRVSIQIHWRAFQELAIGGSRGYGPACMMAQEIMNCTLASGYTPDAKVRQYIKEPAGYMVFKDKLAML